MQSAEKKTGSKLSLDRKNNERGYESKNTRAVPQSLNRGRHSVNSKKLKAWKNRLKKADVDMESFYTLLKAKAQEINNEGLTNLVKSLTPETLSQYIDLIDLNID